MEDQKTMTGAGAPPYEAVQSGYQSPPAQNYPQQPQQQYPASPNMPTQYPHQPIPPPNQQYIHTPAGSPPPVNQSPISPPPPQQQQSYQQYPMQNVNPIQPVQTPPVASPGQEKGQYYAPQQQQQQATAGGVPQQAFQQQQNIAPQGSQYRTAVPLASLMKTPAPVDCPNCHQRALTRVEFHSGNTTHAWALVACFFTLLCCIPYLIKGTKDVEHKCGHCGTLLACYHASGHTEVLSFA